MRDVKAIPVSAEAYAGAVRRALFGADAHVEGYKPTAAQRRAPSLLRAWLARSTAAHPQGRLSGADGG